MSEELHEKQSELLDKFAGFIKETSLTDDGMSRASEALKRTLFAQSGIKWKTDLPAPPILNALQEERLEIMGGYLRLDGSRMTFKEVEYYFRRYPFHDLPVSKSDHLRNVCEMYFDRIWQFRDRLKALTKILQKADGAIVVDFGYLIREFDRFFDFEIRSRNATHHKNRFEYDVLDQLSMIHLFDLTGEPGFEFFDQTQIYRREAQSWVKRVRDKAKSLDIVLIHISDAILSIPSIASLTGRTEIRNGE